MPLLEIMHRSHAGGKCSANLSLMRDRLIIDFRLPTVPLASTAPTASSSFTSTPLVSDDDVFGTFDPQSWTSNLFGSSTAFDWDALLRSP